ncbi:MAG: hypothetical protein MN733_01840, partial [Nitrososphaera sp.]|nr:hypothetical protein [Nitrososphaera sp.]
WRNAITKSAPLYATRQPGSEGSWSRCFLFLGRQRLCGPTEHLHGLVLRRPGLLQRACVHDVIGFFLVFDIAAEGVRLPRSSGSECQLTECAGGDVEMADAPTYEASFAIGSPEDTQRMLEWLTKTGDNGLGAPRP